MANVIKHKRGSGSDPVASDLVVGEVAIRTDVGKLFTKMDNGSVAEIAGGGSDIAINTLSSSSGTGGGSATFNGSAFRFTLSAPPSVSAQQLLVSINGVIQKPVAGTGQPSEGFSVDGTDIILGDAPATGSDFFILTFKSLGVSEPADNSVTSAKIADGAIVNADINASAAIAGTKISPDFGSQAITTTGGLSINGATVFNESGADVDFRIESSGTANMFVLDAGNNRIGLNRPTPLEMFEVGGSIYLTSNTSNANEGNALKFQSKTGGFNTSYGAAIHGLRVGDTSSYLRFDTGGQTERMRIDSSGQVGIGTTSPTGLLHLKSSSAETILKIESESANDAMVFIDTSDGTGANADVRFARDGSTKGRISFLNAGGTQGDMRFTTGSDSEAMRIDSSGRLLVGTTVEGHSTADDLTVATSGHTGISIRSGTSNNGNIYFSDGTSGNAELAGYIQYSHSSNHMLFGTNESNALLIDSSGNVGIGTTSPDQKLHVFESSTSSQAYIHVQNNRSRNAAIKFTTTQGSWFVGQGIGNDNDRFAIYDNQERFVIDSTGNVGIGTTSPDQLFHVSTGGDTSVRFSGDRGNADNLHIANIEFENTFNNQGVIAEIRAITGNSGTQSSQGQLAFYTDNGSSLAERMRIDSSGNVVVGSTSANGSDACTLNSDGEFRGAGFYFSNNIGSPMSSDGIRRATTNTMVFDTASTERMRINASDILFTGSSSQKVAFGVTDNTKYAGFGRHDGAAQDVGLNFYTTTNAGTTFVNHFRIDHNGDLLGTDTNGVSSISDSRVKTDITDYTYDLAKFKQFTPKQFNWKNPEYHGEKTNVKGFLAQDLEAIDTQWVGSSFIEKDHPDYDLVDKSKNGQDEDVGVAKTSKFGGKDAMYISVINQLIARVEALEAK